MTPFGIAKIDEGRRAEPARVTETILLGVIAGRFPNKTLHWDSENAVFKEAEANKFLSGEYRKF